MGTVRYTVIDGEVIAEKRNGVRKLYVPDPLGSTVALLDNTQAQTDTFAYWPYGEVASRTGTTLTPFQFVGTAGYHQDSSSKTYVRARHLDTAKGRWLTEDPIGFRGGDWNLFRYVANTPTLLMDTSGLKPEWDWTPLWLYNPGEIRRLSPGQQKIVNQRSKNAWACLHNIAYTDPAFSDCRAFVGSFSLYNALLCIIGCETSDPPSNTNPFLGDYDKHHHPRPAGSTVGVGPCRLIYGDNPAIMQQNPGWKTQICPNITAGAQIYCDWAMGGSNPKTSNWPATTSSSCYNKCVNSQVQSAR